MNRCATNIHALIGGAMGSVSLIMISTWRPESRLYLVATFIGHGAASGEDRLGNNKQFDPARCISAVRLISTMSVKQQSDSE
ncbi:hypothetical protein PSHT_03075 [Puccinia striiformis]|uniref:Uncharacterized protein n=1 Tax=Puccinia striiformis TaxID=27350 RepID=A0A2S4WGE9_9BASI|nr:hypothetical protein PSHT_03075 [Puccinia striiformis]